MSANAEVFVGYTYRAACDFVQDSAGRKGPKMPASNNPLAGCPATVIEMQQKLKRRQLSSKQCAIGTIEALRAVGAHLVSSSLLV